MKPTEKQQAVAAFIEAQASFWQHTNDINSPTHFSDIDGEVAMVELTGVRGAKRLGYEYKDGSYKEVCKL